MRMLVLLLLLLLLLTGSEALDVQVKSIRCDKSLPISIYNRNFTLTCNGKSQCSFGSDALAQGQLLYSGVGDLGLTNNVAYLKAELDVSVGYINMPSTTVYLCRDNVIVPVDDSSSSCPEDGRYNFNVSFTLPTYDHSWRATGWHESSSVYLYADYGKQTLIGSCTLHYVTKVTSSAMFHKPSAAMVLFLAFNIGVAAVVYALYRLVKVMTKQCPVACNDDDKDQTMFEFQCMQHEKYCVPNNCVCGMKNTTCDSTDEEDSELGSSSNDSEEIHVYRQVEEQQRKRDSNPTIVHVQFVRKKSKSPARRMTGESKVTYVMRENPRKTLPQQSLADSMYHEFQDQPSDEYPSPLKRRQEHEELDVYHAMRNKEQSESSEGQSDSSESESSEEQSESSENS